MTVKKVKGGYVAWSSTRGRLSKKAKTKRAAHKQHAAVKASQARRKKKGR